MTALGLTADQVGSMTIADVLDVFAYWRRVPPVAETLFRAYGGKLDSGADQSRQAPPTEAEVRAFANLLNGG